jgi:pimeloyl-ACP methyl ester carboxylesterase
VGRRIGLEVISGSLSLAAARFVDYWSGDGTWRALDARHQQAIAVRMPKVQAEFEALFADRVPADVYRALAMPVHLLGGSRSPLPARQVLERLHTLLPHASRATLSGHGHMAPVSAPAAVAGLLPRDWRRPALAEAA